ncbi:type II toxin-antitoxin system RelE/ParE family toxin [Humibacter antri]
MSRSRLQTSSQFDMAARRLDKSVLRPIKSYLHEVCDLDDHRQRGKELTADRACYWRYRIDDWRIIAEIQDDTLTIIAIGLGHRSEIYRNQ